MKEVVAEKKKILLPEDVAPAKIIFDDLILDPASSLESQAEWELKEDLFMAEFPNGCLLDVGWYPEFNPSGSFGIALNQTVFGWNPFMRRKCRSIGKLKKIVAELVEIARNRPSIPRVVMNDAMAWPARLLSDDLILDPMAPIEGQLDKLGEKISLAFHGKYRIQVGWLPPHSPTGEFILTLGRVSNLGDFEGPVEYVTKKRCRSIANMLDLFKSLAVQAKQLEESDMPET